MQPMAHVVCSSLLIVAIELRCFLANDIFIAILRQSIAREKNGANRGGALGRQQQYVDAHANILILVRGPPSVIEDCDRRKC